MTSVRERIQKFSGNSGDQTSNVPPAPLPSSFQSSNQSKEVKKTPVAEEDVEKENKPAATKRTNQTFPTKSAPKTSSSKMTTTKVPSSPTKRHSVVPKSVATKTSTDEKRRASVPVTLLSPTKPTSGRPSSSLSQKSSTSSNKTVAKPPIAAKPVARPSSTGGRPVASTVGLGKTNSLRLGGPNDEIERLKKELAGLRARNRELENKISGLKDTVSEESCVSLQVSSNQTDEVTQLKAQHQKDLSSLEQAHKAELEKLSSAVSNAISSENNESFSHLVEQNEASVQKIAEHEMKIKHLEKLIQDAENHIKEATLEVESTKAASEKDIALREEECQSLKQELELLKEKLAQAGYGDGLVNGQVPNEMDRLDKEFEELRQQISLTNEELQRVKDEAERSLEAKDREMDGLSSVLKSLKDELHNLNDTKELEARDLLTEQKAEFEAQIQSIQELNAALSRELNEKTEELQSVISSRGLEIENLQRQLEDAESKTADALSQDKIDKRELEVSCLQSNTDPEAKTIQLTTEISRLTSEHERQLKILRETIENDLTVKFDTELAALKAEHDNDLEEVARTVEKDHESELTLLRNKHDALYQELAAERGSRAEAVEQARLQGVKSAQSDAEEQIARLRNESKQLVRSESQKELDTLKESYELQLKELKAEITSHKTSKEQYLAKISSLEKSVIDIENTLNDQLEKGARAADVMEVIRRETKKAQNNLEDTLSKLAASESKVNNLKAQVSSLEATNQLQKEELEKAYTHLYNDKTSPGTL